MSRPRDSQRSRVYRAENEVAHGQRFATVWEIQQYVNAMTRSAWWQRRYPRVPVVTVEDGRGRRRAAGSRSRQVIKMPRWLRCELVVLHEVAHVVMPYGLAAHGREYMAAYYELVRWRMGDEVADALLAACHKHRVKIGKRTPSKKVQPGPGTDGLSLAHAKP